MRKVLQRCLVFYSELEEFGIYSELVFFIFFYLSISVNIGYKISHAHFFIYILHSDYLLHSSNAQLKLHRCLISS